MTEAAPVEAPVFGRELILASAGSGKTYRLSSRLIGLLAAGVPPQEILASTFTRKAAGEIVDRVLRRLADGSLHPEKALELQGSMPEGVPPHLLSPEGCGELLGRTVRSLHRMQVQTLDAFFHRAVRTFALELGLPQRWALSHEPDRDGLRSRAIEAALAELDREGLLELVRMISRGGGDRDVHRLLMRGVTELHGIFRELDPAVQDPWGFEGGVDGFGEVDEAELDRLIDGIERLELPRSSGGSPDMRWARARERVVTALRARDWPSFLQSRLTGVLLEDGERFAGKEIPPELRELCDPLFGMARSALGVVHHRRMAALGRFLPEYDRRATRLCREEALYDFEDLTHALIGAGELGRSEELFYRLDGRIRHVLLDEFQDTSNAQWAALEPLVGEVLSGYEGERAAFIVADPKQSIYGWRGGEPRILDALSRTYGLEPRSMATSWRSSQVVLDAVNRVFSGLESNAVLSEDPGPVRRWLDAFEPHEAERELRGYVRLETGPEEDTGGSHRFWPRLLAHAARRVAELHHAAPGATIGVLTRTNRSAAHLIATLRRLGIEASEEGGVPVADSAAVLAVLALLRLADHPGDLISRYLVSRTPVGSLVGFEGADYRSDARADEVARGVRARLVRDGMGPVLSGWVRALGPSLPPRDRRRLRQLAELGFAWEPRGTLRAADFVRVAEAERAEDPAAAPVRVMTIYRAKGLEFDAVVLPELDGLSMTGGRGNAYLPYREGGAGPITRIFPGMNRDVRPLFPELAAAVEQVREGEVRDALSSLYVALTRAKYAVYIFVKPDPSGRSRARSGARVLREALAPAGSEGGEEAGTVLWEEGDPAWWQAPPRLVGAPGLAESAPPAGRPGLVESAPPAGRPLLATTPRRRLLPREAPSDLEGGDRVPLERVLRARPVEAMERGTLVHAWLEGIEWWEPEVARDRDRHLELARTRFPGVRDPVGLLDDLFRWLEAPDIRRLLAREAFPPGTRVERELRFLARDGDRILQGSADRVVRIPDPAGERLLVVDWKTDDPRPEGTDDRLVFYRPQMEAYIRGLSRSEGVRMERVTAALAFLGSGRVDELRLSS